MHSFTNVSGECIPAQIFQKSMHSSINISGKHASLHQCFKGAYLLYLFLFGYQFNKFDKKVESESPKRILIFVSAHLKNAFNSKKCKKQLLILPNLKNTNFALTSNSQILVVCGPFSQALKHLWPSALNIAPNVKRRQKRSCL